MTDVLYTSSEHVAVATLNRPARFNCISSGLLAGLQSCLDEAENDPAVRVLLLRADGQHFCTGADLDEVRERSTSADDLDAFMALGHAVMQCLETSRLPVVAAVNGYCLAGGLELALCADVVLLADNGRMGCQHARYGLVPGWGGTQRLPRLVGLRRALDLMYSARWLSADEALAWGLANQIVAAEELAQQSLEYSTRLARGNPEALAAMKRLAREGLEVSLSEGLEMEKQIAVPVLRSDNVAEGLAAFRERREPVFR